MMDFTIVTCIICPFSHQTSYQHFDMQIAGETFDVIKSDVLQGSKVILDDSLLQQQQQHLGRK